MADILLVSRGLKAMSPTVGKGVSGGRRFWGETRVTRPIRRLNMPDLVVAAQVASFSEWELPPRRICAPGRAPGLTSLGFAILERKSSPFHLVTRSYWCVCTDRSFLLPC